MKTSIEQFPKQNLPVSSLITIPKLTTLPTATDKQQINNSVIPKNQHGPTIQNTTSVSNNSNNQNIQNVLSVPSVTKTPNIPSVPSVTLPKPPVTNIPIPPPMNKPNPPPMNKPIPPPTNNLVNIHIKYLLF